MASLTVAVPEDSKQNIESVVSINAPLEKVFDAHVNPDLFTKWFMRGNEVNVKHYEGKTGGSWHIAEKAEDGTEYDFCGSYHEVATNERIIWTFEFLGMPERGHVSIERIDFKKINDNTTEIHMHSTFMSQADRDGMIQSGMEDGYRESVEALGRLLEK